ncbi:high-potential iron-sulfur protein [Paraburkholderia adhaesiva]|uniref:high-potential iron-sulfur protein n=1 Tax=Paraburkholderia adhaesiva TaxID=2883244 RepID=UPI001F414004|nr:high-potential iron-sulfur protein [Paraburkholderia adhaesiva]
MPCSRRQFIAIAATFASTSILLDEARADAPPVSESDPTAQALGYKANAAQVDKAKYPTFQTGQSCSNCQLYQGKTGAASGPCLLFGGKTVNSGGWCSGYTKKA